jgi:hypothetical protein
MKRSNMKWICTVIVAISFSGNLCADEYVKLFAHVEGADAFVSEKKWGDYDTTKSNLDIEREVFDDLKALINDVALVGSTILSLKEGEALELNKPIISLQEQYVGLPSEIDDRVNNWSHWSISGAGPLQGDARSGVHVKFPENDKWFHLNYDSNRKIWYGLGMDSPVIIGPCEIRLTHVADASFRYTNNIGGNSRRYGAIYAGGMSWLFMKKITLGSSSGAATKAQSIVLPEGSGDLSIIMEGSNDLINWTREDLGKKPEANRKTFYRIRAVKE